MASAAKQDERLNHDDGVPQAPDQLTTNQAPAQAESSAAETIATPAEQNVAPAEASAPSDAAQVKPETEAQTEAAAAAKHKAEPEAKAETKTESEAEPHRETADDSQYHPIILSDVSMQASTSFWR